ncbi:Uncharacterised protein [uncultured archaeon]|nr:Uncharacterised protein [uncultured archaeon]
MRVPVLSVHSTSTFPKSSIASSLFTTTFFFASIIAPLESEIVIIIGSNSGATPTAIASAKRSETTMSFPR